MTNETTPDAVERAKLLRSALCAAASDADEIRATLLAERARHAEEVARLEAVHLSALETIEAWKLASGLECGGDPDGVTPAGMRRYWEGVEADRDSLRDQLREVEGERENRVAEMRAWGEAKLAGAQHEITHLRDRLREVEGERDALREEVEDWEAAAQELSNQLVARTKERDDLLGRSPAFAFARIAELESQLTARRAHDADVRALAQWATETEHMSDHVNTDQIGDVARRILAALDSQGGEG